MRNPLQEQLLKAGQVKKSKVAEVAREQAEAERVRQEKAERDRALAAERNMLAPDGETSHGHVVESGDEAALSKSSHDGHGLGYLQTTARDRKNVFEALMEAVKTHSLGQISHADVGGEYRRNM